MGVCVVYYSSSLRDLQFPENLRLKFEVPKASLTQRDE